MTLTYLSWSSGTGRHQAVAAATDCWDWCIVTDGSPLSWWLDREGEKRSYWGGFLPGVQQCSCSLEENCIDMNFFCNCDADTDAWYVMHTFHVLHFEPRKKIWCPSFFWYHIYIKRGVPIILSTLHLYQLINKRDSTVQFKSTINYRLTMIIKLNQHLSKTGSTQTENYNLHERGFTVRPFY